MNDGETKIQNLKDVINSNETIIYIQGTPESCNLFRQNRSVELLPVGIKNLETALKPLYFIRVNYTTIINTRFIKSVNKEPKRTITLSGGYVFKVSRKQWDFFK